MEGKFDGMYMNHPPNKHNELAEEKKRKREAYKKVRSQSTRGCKNSTGSIRSRKFLTLYSHMQSVLYCDCGMYQSIITKSIELYNQSN